MSAFNPSFRFNFLSFTFFLFAFHLYICFFKVRTIMASGVTAHFWGFGHRRVQSTCFTHYQLTLTRFGYVSTELFNFSRTWPNLFLRTLYIERLQLPFRLRYDMTDIRFTYPHKGTNLTQSYVWCALVLFMGAILHRFLYVSISD